MATCLHCGRHLDHNHRCVGVWRLRIGVAGRVLAGAVIVAVMASGVVAAVSAIPSLWFILLVAAVGGIITHTFLRGEPDLPNR